MNSEDRRATGFLLELESAIGGLYSRPPLLTEGFLDRAFGRFERARKKTTFPSRDVISTFAKEAHLSTFAHIAALDARWQFIGERPFSPSTSDLNLGMTEVSRALGLYDQNNSYDVTVDVKKFLLTASFLEDVNLSALMHIVIKVEDHWLRYFVSRLLPAIASRASIARSFLFLMGQGYETNSLAIYRQRAAGELDLSKDHGVGFIDAASIQPVDQEYLGWGRTIEQCTAILGNSASRSFFPFGMHAIKPLNEISQKLELVTLDNLLTQHLGEDHRLANYPSETTSMAPIEVDLNAFSIDENTPSQPWTDIGFTSVSPSVQRLPQALLHGAVGIIAVDSFAVAESVWHTDPARHRFARSDDKIVLLGRSIEKIDGCSVTICVGAAESYWHTLVDSLARLSAIPASVWPSIENLFYPSTAVRMKELLDLFSLPATVNAREVKPYETLEVRDLIVPSSLHGHFDYHPSLLRQTFARLASKVSSKGQTPRFLFVDRRSASLRPLLNENELIDSLPDFTPVRLEEFSIKRQIEIFSSAEIVLGTHGAGLTNIGFCNSKCVVIEIMMDKYCNWCYRRLAAISGQRYISVMGRSRGQAASIHATPWSVDPRDVLEAVERAKSALAADVSG